MPARRFQCLMVTGAGVICALVGAVLLDSAAADSGGWKHPDSRFAAIDAAVQDDNYTAAQKLLADLRGEAKRVGDLPLQGEVQERGKEIAKLARDFEKIGKHLKTLKKGAKDPRASLAVGKYYCVAKGDFTRGLPFLMAGDDEKLSEAASAEDERVRETNSQLELAERWWQCAEKTSDVPERIAWQIRARRWMLRARPAASESQRATIDQLLKQVVLVPEKIVIWNTHNGPSDDRGAEAIDVSLLYQGTVVWNQAVELPFKRDQESFVMLRPKRIRADQVRVEITKHHNRGGGLGEIEVFCGHENIAAGCEPLVDAYWELNEQFVPSKLVDGDRSGATGYWLTDNDKDGWAVVPFAEFGRGK